MTDGLSVGKNTFVQNVRTGLIGINKHSAREGASLVFLLEQTAAQLTGLFQTAPENQRVAGRQQEYN